MNEYSAYGVALSPSCYDFTQTRHSAYFQLSELNSGDYTWALVRDPFVAAATSGYGLDKWREEDGASRIVNSAYRNPVRNFSLQPPGAVNSRHMFGDAADLRNETRTEDEWNLMDAAALRAQPDFVEPRDGPCGLGCVHADWRNHSGDYLP